jgi:hypothetical protein
MVKIKFRDATCTRRNWGIYRFGPDGLSLSSFPGEPEDYDPAARRNREVQRRLDLGVLNLMRSAERRRMLELVHADGDEPTPPSEPPAPPLKVSRDDTEDRQRYLAANPEEQEQKTEPEPRKRPEPIVSAAGTPLAPPPDFAAKMRAARAAKRKQDE